MNDKVLKIIYDKNDIEYLKLYLYLYENHIDKISNDNIENIISSTNISKDKISEILSFYKENLIFPKTFTSNLIINNSKEIVNNSNKETISISNYCNKKFNTNIDYQYFFKNKLNEYDYDIDIYKYIIDYCSSDDKFKNINFINWVLKDISEKNIKNIEDLNSYITSSTLYNKNIVNNKKTKQIDREQYNKLFKENILKLKVFNK